MIVSFYIKAFYLFIWLKFKEWKRKFEIIFELNYLNPKIYLFDISLLKPL